MPDYTYTAWSVAGVPEKNIMTAISPRAVADALRSQGLTPSRIAEVGEHSSFKLSFDALKKIKLIDKITFIKNLSVMVKSGLPVSKTLKILTTQTQNKKFAKIVDDISRQVEGGIALADALSKYPAVFSSIFINMVRVGELSGNLEQNLNYLADQMQRDYDLTSKAKGAMTYPIVVMVALAIVGFLMFTFVLPKLTATFKDSGVALPIMTRIVIGIVDIFAAYGIFIFIGVVILAFVFMHWRKTVTGKKIVHKVLLNLPIFADIVKKINLARFVRVFASLIKSGMPIVEALEVSSNVVANVYYQRIIADAASKVKIGSPLTTAFKKEPKLFPNLVVQMMEVGEESGTTDVILTEVANFYEAEVDQTMKNLSSILEPVIMMVIGGVVGVLAIAIITPIYNITQSIG